MAPHTRKYFRNKTRFQTKEISTQTETFSHEDALRIALQPVVLLEKIDSQEHESTYNEARNTKTVRNATKVLRVPTNYHGFKEPITNNEKVNSTLLMLEKNQQLNHVTPTTSSHTKSIKPKRVCFIKPGPLCYKQRMLNSISEEGSDLQIPSVLTEKNSEHLSPHRFLNTIQERSKEENTPPLQFEETINHNVDVVETIVNDSVQENVEDIREILNTGSIIVSRSNSENQIPSIIRIQLRGDTSVTSGQQNENFSQREQFHESRGEQEHQDMKFPDFIKINATTVHIHNHFYGTFP